jgi:glycosyltransferase involved in cell wall biosynthesis
MLVWDTQPPYSVPARGRIEIMPNSRRSAFRADAPADGWPGVSYVMPVLNEERDLREAVTSVLDQDYPGEAELILALGPSHDATDLIAAEIAESDSRVHLVRNPQASIPTGLNLAIRASSFPVLVRVDAHSTLSEGYTRTAVALLHETGAANVGGVMRAQGRNPVQKAIAHGYNSRLGLGGGAYHGHGTAGPAESAYLGVFRRSAIREVGGFDEGLARGEDWELNLRLRQAGHVVWFDPRLVVTYWPRTSWEAVARQFFATGNWRGDLVRRYKSANSVRFFAPPLLVAGCAASAAVTVLDTARLIPRRLRGLARLVHVPVAGYAALVAAEGFRTHPSEEFGDDENSLLVKALVPPVLATMHVCWGVGFLRGMLRGAEGSLDTSRVATTD